MSQLANLTPEQYLNELKRNPSAIKADATGTVIAQKAPHKSKDYFKGGSYYKLHFAREVQVTIDKMMQDGEDCQYSYEQFPHLKASALYLRITQSLLYLIRELDTEDRQYAQFRKRIEVTRENTGVCLRIKKAHVNVAAQKIKPREDKCKWKESLEDILENGALNRQYKISQLQLTPEEQTEIRLIASEIKGVTVVVTSYEIVIVKLDVKDFVKL